jgi:hypothetical protein
VTLGLCRRPQETHQAHVVAAIAFNRGTDSHRRDLKTAETLLFVSTAYMHCQESMSLWKEMPTHGSAAEGDQSRSRRRVVNKQERRPCASFAAYESTIALIRQGSAPSSSLPRPIDGSALSRRLTRHLTSGRRQAKLMDVDPPFPMRFDTRWVGNEEIS